MKNRPNLTSITATLAAKTILCLSAVLFPTHFCFAQMQALVPAEELPGATVYFRQGVSDLDLSYGGNAASLDSIVRGVNRLLADPEVLLHAIIVETGASPEGSYERNEELSMNRARSIRKYLLEHLAISSVQVKAFSVGVDWEGLYTLLRASDSKWKDDAMRIISDCDVRMNADRAASERCISRLKALGGGKAWVWMLTDLFPNLRTGSGDIRCVVYREPKATDPVRDTVVIFHEYDRNAAVGMDAAAVNALLDSRANEFRGFRNDSLFRTPVIAFRTNLFLPLMNIGLEVPLGNRLSVSADIYAPWIWRDWIDRFAPAHKYCFEAMSVFVDGRIWLGKTHRKGDDLKKYRLLGHSIELVATAGHYDYENNYGMGQPTGANPWKGQQGEYIAFGLGYCYACPLGKKGGTHFEFEAAFGYALTQYMPYYVYEEGGKLISDTKQKECWNGPVPVRIGFSLVIPIWGK